MNFTVLKLNCQLPNRVLLLFFGFFLLKFVGLFLFLRLFEVVNESVGHKRRGRLIDDISAVVAAIGQIRVSRRRGEKRGELLLLVLLLLLQYFRAL